MDHGKLLPTSVTFKCRAEAIEFFYANRGNTSIGIEEFDGFILNHVLNSSPYVYLTISNVPSAYACLNCRRALSLFSHLLTASTIGSIPYSCDYHNDNRNDEQHRHADSQNHIRSIGLVERDWAF